MALRLQFNYRTVKMSTCRFILIVSSKLKNDKEFEERKIKLTIKNTTMITDKEFKKRLRISDIAYNDLLQDKDVRNRPIGTAFPFDPNAKNASRYASSGEWNPLPDGIPNVFEQIISFKQHYLNVFYIKA